jgi:hypothetical protein
MDTFVASMIPTKHQFSRRPFFGISSKSLQFQCTAPPKSELGAKEKANNLMSESFVLLKKATKNNTVVTMKNCIILNCKELKPVARGGGLGDKAGRTLPVPNIVSVCSKLLLAWPIVRYLVAQMTYGEDYGGEEEQQQQLSDLWFVLFGGDK